MEKERAQNDHLAETTNSPKTRLPGSQPSLYLSFVLRMWAEPKTLPSVGHDTVGPAGGAWRISLEDLRTGERRGFADLAKLNAYLATMQQQMVEPPVRPAEANMEAFYETLD